MRGRRIWRNIRKEKYAQPYRTLLTLLCGGPNVAREREGEADGRGTFQFWGTARSGMSRYRPTPVAPLTGGFLLS